MQSLTPFHTFHLPAQASQIIPFTSIEQLLAEWQRATLANQPILILGQGSNMLFLDDFEGVVLVNQLKGIEHHEDADFHYLTVQGGENWHALVKWTLEHGIAGLENLALIPGVAGSAPIQNIGAYGSEAKDVIYRIEAIDLSNGESVVLKNEDCNYGYRKSKFKTIWKGRFFITHVTYLVKKEFQPNVRYGNIKAVLAEKGIEVPTLSQLREVIIEIRKSKLPEPSEEGNAGSFFMNPIVLRSTFEVLLAQYPDIPHYFVDEEHEKIPAGWLIEQCGWKGKTLGKAGVHAKQALVLVNKGGASGNEILTLCNTICSDVQSKFGITIHPEVNIL